MRISVELPIEQGELVAKALERAAGKGDSALGVEFTATGAGGVSESAAA